MEENKSAFSNDNVYANVNPTEIGGQNGYNGYNGAAGNGGAGGNAGAAGGFGNPGYNGYNPGYTPDYNSPIYNQPNTGYNMLNNEVKCPGKEITSMVLGILSIFYGGFGVLFCWHPVFAWVFGLFGVGCGIPALVLHSSVMKIATVTTKKVKVGKNLGTAGIICGALAMVLDIIFILVVIFAFGSSMLADLL